MSRNVSWSLLATLSCMVGCGGKDTHVIDDADAAGVVGGDADAAGVVGGDADAAGVVGGDAEMTDPSVDGPLRREPAKHRPTAVACDHDRAASEPVQRSDPYFHQCPADEECTAGANGRCSLDGSKCTYDMCFVDDDCVTTSDAGAVTRGICRCGGDRSNVCIARGCQTDAECNGHGCSPTFGPCGYNPGVVSYQCHTAADECVDDADCVDGGAPSSMYGAYCAFAPAVGHWKCSPNHCDD